jgi:integrase
MKAHKEHRVPLSDRALAILELVRPEGTAEGLVFRGKWGKPLHNTALAKCAAPLGQDAVTIHGFRSTFRDWCAEQTNVPSEIAEAALAHTTGSAVERAYRRTDALDKRAIS